MKIRVKNKPILDIRNLSVLIEKTPLVDSLSFSLEKGKTVGLVGESGSGKSLTSLAIMRLLAPVLKTEGEIFFDNKNLLKLSEKEMLAYRGKQIAMVFQEPMTALNPTMKCGKQVLEAILKHQKISQKEARKKVLQLFEKTELPRPVEIYDSYPHQISGGQKQRVVIALAICNEPKILIADEPTTALDATVQKSILDILKKLQTELGMGMIFISHDLGVVHQIADEVVVMKAGKTMEKGTADQIFNRPENAYTKGLLACRPTPDTQFVRLPTVSDFEDKKRPKLKMRSREKRLQNIEIFKQNQPLLSLKKLDKIYGKSGFFSKAKPVNALENVELNIYPNETLGLVGESGSGKSTLGKILCGLENPSEGAVIYKKLDIAHAGPREWRRLHKEIQIIFQDPFSSLNPRIKIGEAIGEAVAVRGGISRKKRKAEVLQLLEKVGLPNESFQKYPHEFSGGQRQRIGIARALAVRPEFIVCDESVSALDVSVQAQVLNLLNDLKDEFGLTYLFISHDLAVVKYFADRIAVLKDGKLVEMGGADSVYENPKTDYTKKLVESVSV